MGLNIKESFVIDAAKLLAKLHRGACETHADVMFFNSGVIDDQKIAPSECEKSKISFDTKMDQCQLGVVVRPEIQCRLKHTANDIRAAAAEAKKKDDEKAKITDNPDQKTNESDIPSFMAFIGEDDKKEGGEPGEILVDPLQEPKDASDEIKKMVKENQDALEKEVDPALKMATKYLQDYMTVFAGAAEAEKIADKAVTRAYLPDGADPVGFKYKNGIIEGVSDEDRTKAWHEELKKKPDTDVYIIKNLCFKIAYALNMEE